MSERLRMPLIGRQFPKVSARLLTGEPLELPENVRGTTALILLAFFRQEPGVVDSWIEPFEKRFGPNPRYTVYRLAMLGETAIPGIIDLGMKKGVAKEKHTRVAVSHQAWEPLMDDLLIGPLEDLQAYLLDQNGIIRWHGTGEAGEAAMEKMLAMADQWKPR